MHLLVLLVFVALLFYVWPNGAKYLLVAPLFGVALGGLTWSIAAMLFVGLITWHTLGLFLLCGVVVSEFLAFNAK